MPIRIALLALLVTAACSRAPSSAASAAATDAPRLPTGARLDPAGAQWPVGNFPLAARWSPDSSAILLLLNGYREQGVQVLDASTGEIRQTLLQPAAFLGMAFAPGGRTLYVSGGNADVIYRYTWQNGRATLLDSLIVRAKATPRDAGRAYPAGLALSPDGTWLYVAENLGDSLAVLDTRSGAVIQRLPAGRYPYGVVTTSAGQVFVSSWAERTVYRFAPAEGGRLRQAGTATVGRHPSEMLLFGDRLFVTSSSTDAISVVDPNTLSVITTLRDPVPGGLKEGSTPSGLAARCTPDGARLFIAESDNNAVAVFNLSRNTVNVDCARGTDSLVGRVPAGWYPSTVLASEQSLFVVNAKGKGTAPNPALPHPGSTSPNQPPRAYTLGQIDGSITRIPMPSLAELAPLSARVTRANGWDSPRARGTWPPIEHVIYIIKENRTYDQVFSDLRGGDGDTSLLFFPRAVSPNHHALAERFGLYDRFFVNAEVSADGHNWSVAAYTTDYTQKTTPTNYSGRGRSYDYEGTNRGRVPTEDGVDDVAEPSEGYLWDLAARKGITFRNYGEFTEAEEAEEGRPRRYRGTKPFLRDHTNPDFPQYDLDIPDQRRADVWLKDLASFVAQGKMPAFQILHLPNDHTSGARAGTPTPRAHMADNDLALGRIIEALSRSPFWRTTAVFVLEDDAQNGPDHVDSHRSLLLTISPWAKGGVWHRFTNTTDVIATMEHLLGLDALSPFDHYGRPLREIWREVPDVRPYTALTPSVPLTEKNPPRGTGARESQRLDLAKEDRADEDAFNRILWRAIKGDGVPYPGPTRAAAAELVRSR